MIDFTDSANPVEIAWFDRGPIDAEDLVLGGFWSTYWYGDRIYGTEIARGLDVLALLPSDHLSTSEIAAAALADQGGAFNPQRQLPVAWPDHPVVARAYRDQLARAEALPAARIAEVDAALDRAEAALDAGAPAPDLADELTALATALPGGGSGDAIADARRRALAGSLTGIAARLR